MELKTSEDKFNAVKSLMLRAKVGALEGSFIYKLADKIDEVIDKGNIEYDFCASCLMEISGEVPTQKFNGHIFHKYCFDSEVKDEAKV